MKNNSYGNLSIAELEKAAQTSKAKIASLQQQRVDISQATKQKILDTIKEPYDSFGEYLAYFDKQINQQQETYKKNRQGPDASVLLTDTSESKDKKEYLVKMFLTLDKRHADYAKEKAAYTPEQRAIVNKIEKESGGEVKIIVDPNFLKAFNKLTGVDYRGVGVLGDRVIVSKPEDLLRESLLRHEAIHCAQQRDMGFWKWLALSLASSKKKQFFGPERGTPSAVDYGTENQITDLETYINQYDPNYLPNRRMFAHEDYRNPEFLQQELKRVREQELEMKKKRGDKDIAQFERMLEHLENDKEVRLVLVEPDVLPSKVDINSPEYDERAQVRTESVTNMKKRIALEKTLYKDTLKKLAAKKEELWNTTDPKEEKEIREEVRAYEEFLARIKDDEDKNRKRMKRERDKSKEYAEAEAVQEAKDLANWKKEKSTATPHFSVEPTAATATVEPSADAQDAEESERQKRREARLQRMAERENPTATPHLSVEPPAATASVEPVVEKPMVGTQNLASEEPIVETPHDDASPESAETQRLPRTELRGSASPEEKVKKEKVKKEKGLSLREKIKQKLAQRRQEKEIKKMDKIRDIEKLDETIRQAQEALKKTEGEK